MRFFRLTFDVAYGYKVTDETLEIINKSLQEPVKDLHSWVEHIGDVDALLPILPPEVKIKLVGTADTSFNVAILHKLSAIEQRLTSYRVPYIYDGAEGPDVGAQQQFNSRVNVHVPGLGLMTVAQVMLLEDACTDKLQQHLTDGWHILAVCPQPDQRRPDYILGRSA